MKLSRRYETYLLRSRLRPLLLTRVKKKVKIASDLELVVLHDKITNELKQRGILNE